MGFGGGGSKSGGSTFEPQGTNRRTTYEDRPPMPQNRTEGSPLSRPLLTQEEAQARRPNQTPSGSMIG